MEPALKQRLVGAAVLVALAVIFLPMLVQGPAPDSGAADVPLTMPDAPDGGFETRELPLVIPAGTPEGGALGMEPAQGGTPAAGAADAGSQGAEAAIIEEAPPAAELAALPETPEPTTKPAPSKGQDANGGMFPAATASGDYAVSFGSYSTVAAADAIVASLRQSQLPAYREAARIDGKTWQRVRIGPYATRAEAEAARLRAAHVRDDVNARVLVLDGDAPAPASAPVPAGKPVAKAPAVKAPAVADTGFAVQLAAFTHASDAIALRDRARAAGFSAFTEAVRTEDGTLTRVRVGPVLTREQAEQLRLQVREKLGRQLARVENGWAVYEIPLVDDTKPVNFIMHRPSGDAVPDTREPGGDRSFLPINSPEVWMKGGTSPVSEADYAVDSFLRDVLLAAYATLLPGEREDVHERLARALAASVDDRTKLVFDAIEASTGAVWAGSSLAACSCWGACCPEG